MKGSRKDRAIDETNRSLIHPTGDEALSHLSNIPGIIGDFVFSYPGILASAESKWLDTWFLERIRKHFDQTQSYPEKIKLPESLSTPKQFKPLTQHITLKSVQPHYFRGFREVEEPINLDSGLAIIDGRNTSGKTSLAEALEWLFIGGLSRRDSQYMGSPHELEDCIKNEFRPDGEETWVSGEFVLKAEAKTEIVKLRRVLKIDYGSTSTSKCRSVLFMNDKELSGQEEREILDELFASVEPVLMQHTLRQFIRSSPKERRNYFERLLKLDELTNLVSEAVIGDARLADFPSPTNDMGLQRWYALGQNVQQASSGNIHSKVYKSDKSDLSATVRNALTKIARTEFPDLVSKLSQLDEINSTLVKKQKLQRQESFPLLANLRPEKKISYVLVETSYKAEIASIGKNIREKWKSYEATERATSSIGNDRLKIAQALKILTEAGLIEHDPDSQTCPVCAYEQAKTLSAARIAEIESWYPILKAKSSAGEVLKKEIDSLLNVFKEVIVEHDELLPELPPEADWEEALSESGDELLKAAQELRKIRKEDDKKLEKAIKFAKQLLSDEPPFPSSSDECEELIKQCEEIINELAYVPAAAQRYFDAFRKIESAVGVEISVDPEYRLRESWLNCFDNITAIIGDFQWERAKRHAQRDLEDIREALINYRQQFLESSRISFNQGIQSVWHALRSDEYSSFSELHIPPPSGRGFPVEIQVKAMLSDGQQQREVNALRVFSESQVNALGVAAFVTRSQLLGHRLLIFDDPVQSMDEDHCRTFASDLLEYILVQGFQVILLTHYDLFARDISHYHSERTDYVTLNIRMSKQKGCIVEEGSRLFHERLKKAEQLVDEGKLSEAWVKLRLAIERLYTIVYKKHGPPEFNPHSWKDQSAEYMWNSGAGNIIDGKLPGAGEELKDILDMTIAGAHDKPPRGETDLRNSIRYLKSLPSKLNVGG